jgi:hypothetical protein
VGNSEAVRQGGGDTASVTGDWWGWRGRLPEVDGEKAGGGEVNLN